MLLWKWENETTSTLFVIRLDTYGVIRLDTCFRADRPR